MQVVDLLHADIDTGLSRIDTSISSFEVLTQSIPSESSTQGLQRIERHLQNLLEETDFNLKKVYNDRKRLINLNYNNWSMDHVHQFDKITKQFFHMKDVLRQLSDRIANNSVKPFSKAIKEEDVKVECAPSSPQDAIIESPTTTSRKRGETRTDQTVKKIINALPATQSDARPAQKHAHLATSLNANVKVRTGLLPVPCKSEDPPTPQENSYKKRKTAKETPTTTTETRKFSCDTEQPIGESGRRSDSPSRKKSREALKPVSIPTERIPNHQTPSVSEVRTDVFDPRSKSYHIWKQATTSHNDAFRGVPLRSYTIPKEWDKFERDFRKHSDSLVRDFIAKHASPVKTTDEVNVGQSDAAATKTETAVASETMETPVPINSTAQHNDATSVQPIIRTERHTVSEPSSSSCKPQIAARKQSHKENISEKTIEDDDSDIELMLVKKHYMQSKDRIYSQQLRILKIQSKLYTVARKLKNLDILQSEGLACVRFFSWSGNEIMKICEFCAEKKDLYRSCMTKLESKPLNYVKSCTNLIDNLAEIAETTCLIYRTVTKDIDQRIDNLLPHEKYVLFERLALVEDNEEMVFEDCGLIGLLQESEDYEFVRLPAESFDQLKKAQPSLLPSMPEYVRRVALDNAFNSNMKTIMTTGKAFPTQYLESYRVLAEFEKNYTSSSLEDGLNDFKRRFSSWAYTQRAKTVVEPSRDWNEMAAENSKYLLKYFRGNPNVTSISLKKDMDDMADESVNKIVEEIGKDIFISQLNPEKCNTRSEKPAKQFVKAKRAGVMLEDDAATQNEVVVEVEVGRVSDGLDIDEDELDSDDHALDSDDHALDSDDHALDSDDHVLDSDDHVNNVSQADDSDFFTPGTNAENICEEIETEEPAGQRVLPFRTARNPINKTPLFSSHSLFTDDDLDCNASIPSPTRKSSRSPTPSGLRARKVMKLATARSRSRSDPSKKNQNVCGDLLQKIMPGLGPLKPNESH